MDKFHVSVCASLCAEGICDLVALLINIIPINKQRSSPVSWFKIPVNLSFPFPWEVSIYSYYIYYFNPSRGIFHGRGFLSICFWGYRCWINLYLDINQQVEHFKIVECDKSENLYSMNCQLSLIIM